MTSLEQQSHSEEISSSKATSELSNPWERRYSWGKPQQIVENEGVDKVVEETKGEELKKRDVIKPVDLKTIMSEQLVDKLQKNDGGGFEEYLESGIENDEEINRRDLGGKHDDNDDGLRKALEMSRIQYEVDTGIKLSDSHKKVSIDHELSLIHI